MVLPLRFPPGMAGGLLLAYPRMLLRETCKTRCWIKGSMLYYT